MLRHRREGYESEHEGDRRKHRRAVEENGADRERADAHRTRKQARIMAQAIGCHRDREAEPQQRHMDQNSIVWCLAAEPKCRGRQYEPAAEQPPRGDAEHDRQERTIDVRRHFCAREKIKKNKRVPDDATEAKLETQRHLSARLQSMGPPSKRAIQPRRFVVKMLLPSSRKPWRPSSLCWTINPAMPASLRLLGHSPPRERLAGGHFWPNLSLLHLSRSRLLCISTSSRRGQRGPQAVHSIGRRGSGT